MTITALPTPPTRSDPVNFPERADTFLGALPLFQEEANELAVELNTLSVNTLSISNGYLTQAKNSATSAAGSATAASVSATNAATSSNTAKGHADNAAASNGAVRWVSGTTYTVGTLVWSPVDSRTYRRIVAGAGTTDPSSDTTNWKILSVVVEQEDIGTDPGQVPLNQYLGELAFMNKDQFVITPATSTEPQQLGSMTFQLTNNTTLVVKVKGTDGITRSSTITLA